MVVSLGGNLKYFASKSSSRTQKTLNLKMDMVSLKTGKQVRRNTYALKLHIYQKITCVHPSCRVGFFLSICLINLNLLNGWTDTDKTLHSCNRHPEDLQERRLVWFTLFQWWILVVWDGCNLLWFDSQL